MMDVNIMPYPGRLINIYADNSFGRSNVAKTLIMGTKKETNVKFNLN
jgi:hypothetical protein